MNVFFSRWLRQPAHARRLRLGLRVVLWGWTLVALLLFIGSRGSSMIPGATGKGAGGVGQVVLLPGHPIDPCSELQVGPCLAQSVFTWVATQVQQTVQPITDAVLHNDIDIIYQTPAPDSYQNATVVMINEALVKVVDLALATLLIIGAYTVMAGSQFSLPHASLGPRDTQRVSEERRKT